MSFLNELPVPHRELLERAASPLELAPGEFLIRRGNPGGDIYLLDEGVLDVVDTRTTPEIVLNTLREGALVGELAFVDGSPRSADVRAATPCRVRVWPRDDLRTLLQGEPSLSASFHQLVARIAADRLRGLTSSAVRGAFGAAASRPGDASAVEDARKIAEKAKSQLIEAETRLRHDAADASARARVHRVLDALQVDIASLAANHADPNDRDPAVVALSRELHPYLVRSALAERSLRRPEGLAATAEILAYVEADVAGGEGELGDLVDRWLLDRPTFQALRASQSAVVAAVDSAIGHVGEPRMLLVDAGSGALASRLCALGRGVRLTVVDQRRTSLASLEASLAAHATARVVPVRESIPTFALGRSRAEIAPQHAIVLHGVLEYLPTRIVLSLLQVCRALLEPGGTVVIATVGPTPDQALVDHLLGWQTVRRTPDVLLRLFDAVGLRGVAANTPAGCVVVGAHAEV